MSNTIGTIGDHPLDDLAAYALDALDDAERQAVDDHLTRCPECRAELAGHHETLAALTPGEAPPAAVWQRIADGIGAAGMPDPHTAGPAGSSPTAYDMDEPARSPVAGSPGLRRARHDIGDVSDGGGGDRDSDAGGGTISSLAQAARARAQRPSRFSWLAAASVAAAAAVIGGVVGFAVGTTSDDGADIGTLAQQAAEQPDGVLATLASTGGHPVARVVADEDGAFMVLEGLQDLPEGQAYQLWSLTGPQPVSLGMLGRDGTNTVAFRLPPTITDLAISVEPTSGEVAPTSDFQALGSISRSS